jgi:predicted nucleic acid-binding protein
MAPQTSGFVVDASVSAAWFLPDEANPRTEAALLATATQDVWVPALWLLEIGNLLLRAQRRKRITADKRVELAKAASALQIKVDREPVAITVIDELAARYGLSAYDAAYLELALRRGVSLATQDDALAAAMLKAGVLAPPLSA